MNPKPQPSYLCSVIPKVSATTGFVEFVETEDSDDDDDLFVRIFRCSKCKESFNVRRQLQRHVRRVHLNVRKKLRGGLARSLVGNRGNYRGWNDEDDHMSSSKESTDSRMSTTFEQTKDLLKLRWKCSFPIVVLVPRLKFLEISVSTPSKGVREIYFTSGFDTSLKRNNTSGSSSESGSLDSSSSSYEDWRVVSIAALQKKIKPPEPPSVSKCLNPPPLAIPSEENKSLFLKVPCESTCMFNVNGIKDYNLHAIVDVLTGEKMTTDVLDAYLTLLLSSYNNQINAGVRSGYQLRPISQTNFHYLSVCFLPVFARNQCPSTFQANPRHLPKISLDEDCVLIAPMYACQHYYLAVFNCYTKCVYVYDSSWGFMPVKLRLQQVEKVLGSLFPLSEHPWKIFFEFNCAQQIDEHSCGCYVIYFAENHLKSKSHRNVRNLNKAELMQLRNNIIMELLPTTKTGNQLLEAITE